VEEISAHPYQGASDFLAVCFLEDIVNLLVQELVFAHLLQFSPRQRPAQTTQCGFPFTAFLAWLPFQYDVMRDYTHRLAPFPLPGNHPGWTLESVSAIPVCGFNATTTPNGNGSIPNPRLAISFNQLFMNLGPVNTCKIAALLPEIRPGKARGEKFGVSK
jgi:hypothetical protein